MSLIVDSCLLKKLAGGLSKLCSADDDAVAWLTNYGGPYRIHITTQQQQQQQQLGNGNGIQLVNTCSSHPSSLRESSNTE